MPRIEALSITDEILDKIEQKHGVTFEEVEESCLSRGRHVRRGREGLYEVYAQTEEGRYLFVVLADAGGSVWQVVTARVMTPREQRLYRQVRGGR
jgi:uncharacterized DUF497 family protein